MHFTKISGALALTALGQALIIPPEITADGVYSVVTRDDGTELHTRIGDVAEHHFAGRDPTLSIVDQRDILTSRSTSGQVWCGCGWNMDTANCDAAVQDLKTKMINSSVGSGLSVYSIRSNVVAFACNRGTTGVSLDADLYDATFGDITSECGSYIAGSKDLIGGDSSFIVGYQRYANGDDYCAMSTTSPADHC